MPGSCELSALHPKPARRTSAFTSRVIVISRWFCLSFLLCCLQEGGVIHHCSRHNCDIRSYLYQLSFSGALSIKFAGLDCSASQGTHSSSSTHITYCTHAPGAQLVRTSQLTSILTRNSRSALSRFIQVSVASIQSIFKPPIQYCVLFLSCSCLFKYPSQRI